MGLFRILNYGGLAIRPAGFLALVLMLPYGILTGNSVSVLRAMCMFLLTILAKMTGRIYDMLTALSLAAILLLLDSPAYLYSSGFLMSFGAVVGLGVTAPAVCRIWKVENHMIKGLVSAASIQITMLPVQLWFFGEISVAGMFLNLLVVPTAAAVLCSGVGAVLLGSISIKAARAAALCGRFLFHIYAWLGELSARIPGNTWIAGQPRKWKIVLYYILLFGGLWLMKGIRKKYSGKGTAAACAFAGITGLLFLGGLLGYHPRRALTVTCLDVGQGDAAVIQTPAGACYMIDCGSSGKKHVGKNQLLPFLKNQGIAYVDGIFVSHTDEDHISGIRSLLEYIRGNLTAIRVGSLILPEWETPPESWKELERLAKEAGAVVQYAGKGKQCRSGAVCMKILAPEKASMGTDVNEEAMVIELRYGSFSGLFTGDIGQKTEERLLESMGDADFLKVAHHGSRYSTGEAFLEQVQPEYAVISCSEHNLYGHPSPETVARLENRGIHVNYTMKSGAVTLRTDGTRIRIETYLAS
ncbi:MAG: DNA internalization-related competence protein ComEC/Rec2 [Blautia sp.]|nr:DNA internalization-related competence protein ComEC/Rec2 [Blautia sp.]